MPRTAASSLAGFTVSVFDGEDGPVPSVKLSSSTRPLDRSHRSASTAAARPADRSSSPGLTAKTPGIFAASASAEPSVEPSPFASIAQWHRSWLPPESVTTTGVDVRSTASMSPSMHRAPHLVACVLILSVGEFFCPAVVVASARPDPAVDPSRTRGERFARAR